MLKSNIPIANVRFFDKTPTVAELERRFSRYLRGFREQRCAAEQIERFAEDGPTETFELSANSLSSRDKIKIERRALRYVELQEAATGMQHLRTEERNALRRLQNGATVSRVSNEHDADVLAAALHEEMPWMAPATEHIGLVTLTFRSLNSFMRPFVQMPRDFCRLAMSGGDADCRSH